MWKKSSNFIINQPINPSHKYFTLCLENHCTEFDRVFFQCEAYTFMSLKNCVRVIYRGLINFSPFKKNTATPTCRRVIKEDKDKCAVHKTCYLDWSLRKSGHDKPNTRTSRSSCVDRRDGILTPNQREIIKQALYWRDWSPTQSREYYGKDYENGVAYCSTGAPALFSPDTCWSSTPLSFFFIIRSSCRMTE